MNTPGSRDAWAVSRRRWKRPSSSSPAQSKLPMPATYASVVRHAECRLSLEAHKHRSLAVAAQNAVKLLSRDREGAVL
jgi:hypothetical protein